MSPQDYTAGELVGCSYYSGFLDPVRGLVLHVAVVCQPCRLHVVSSRLPLKVRDDRQTARLFRAVDWTWLCVLQLVSATMPASCGLLWIC